MTSSIRPLLAVVLGLCSAAALASSSPATEFVEAQRANKAALREYTWKSRTELKLKGEVKNVTMDQVRHDLDGMPQKTQIGGSPAEQERQRGRLGGPIRQHIVAKKKEAFKELLHELTTLVQAYAHLPEHKLQAFAKRASISKGHGAESGTVRLHGEYVLVAGDSMSVWIDPTSFTMRRVDISTTLESKPVSLVTDFRNLENGLTFQARTVLRYPDKEVELSVENFDHQHVGIAR